MTKKIGFWPSVALVTGNIIGAGIFLLPATMASYHGIVIDVDATDDPSHVL